MKEQFVYFRLPAEKEINAWSLDTAEQIRNVPVDRKGFVLYPFDEKNTSPLFFPFIKDLDLDLSFINLKLDHGLSDNSTAVNKETYSRIINKFKDTASSDFQKVVLSRQIQIDKKPGYLPELFQKLVKSYPNAFVWLLHSKVTGTFLGASPEILLEKNEKTLNTVALAGTRPLNTEFTEKERDEQAFVQTYIESWLARNHLSFTKSNTAPIKAGEILHLKTRYEIDSSGFSNKMINDLHPTPAVCGTPSDKAKDFIKNHEGYDRRYYAGFIGPVENDRFQLYVNIRSAQLFKDFLIVSAGGGITIDSDPGAEWEETRWKASLFND